MLSRPFNDLRLVVVNFMKLFWRENFIEIFTLKFCKKIHCVKF